MKDNGEFQKNIKASFRFVEEDINHLVHEQQRMQKRIEFIESIQRRMLHSFANAPADHFIGNLETGEIHREDCLLVASIKNIDRTQFTNKFEALQKGFRECLCLY